MNKKTKNIYLCSCWNGLNWEDAEEIYDVIAADSEDEAIIKFKEEHGSDWLNYYANLKFENVILP